MWLTTNTNYVSESNAVLKTKFKKLQQLVDDNVNAADIVDFLFQDGVIGNEDVRMLQKQGDHRQQCHKLLGLLQASKHPQAFVQLYRAIKEEPDLQWLVECIDEFSLQLLQEQRHLNDPSGNKATTVCNFRY